MNAMSNQPCATAPPRLRHRFNRYEIKYLVPEHRIPALRDELSSHLALDPMAPEGGYQVESLYFDSPGLRFYHEKIDGLKFRRKLRLRRYGDGPVGATDPVSVEIKQRVNKVTQKRRLTLPFLTAVALSDSTGRAVGHLLSEPFDAARLAEEVPERDRALVNEIASFSQANQLRPIATTSYRREAFEGTGGNHGVRVTFDHHISGRDRDFRLGSSREDDRPTVSLGTSVVEIKCDERVPLWLTDLTARQCMDVIRISKYCATVEAFDLRLASATHVEPLDFSDDPALPAAAAASPTSYRPTATL